MLHNGQNYLLLSLKIWLWKISMTLFSMYCHQYFFGDKYDLIQLHRQIIHQNDGISMRN